MPSLGVPGSAHLMPKVEMSQGKGSDDKERVSAVVLGSRIKCMHRVQNECRRMSSSVLKHLTVD